MSDENLEYLVSRDYHNEKYDFELVEGDIVSEESFDADSLVMFDRLIGRGILVPVGTEPVVDENRNN